MDIRKTVTIKSIETSLTLKRINNEAIMKRDHYKIFEKEAEGVVCDYVKRRLDTETTKEVRNVDVSADIKLYSMPLEGISSGKLTGAVDNIRVVLNFADGSRQVIDKIDDEPISSGLSISY